ncbi:hypothetical protein, partial [Rhizobium sp. GCM10022189]|uniref:hypothetical protein n=1 Tax=Rhizobium sp. GCM10022189 TaxID=3252654 RepID=UPI003610D00F
QTSHDMKAKGRQLRLPHGQTGNNQTFKNKTRRKNRRVCQRSEGPERSGPCLLTGIPVASPDRVCPSARTGNNHLLIF